ncbi:MAG: hypothetical protein ACYC35_10845 [Pirellulales bacterium]
MSGKIRLIAVSAVVLGLAAAAQTVVAAAGTRISAAGVQVWVSQEKFHGDLGALERAAWQDRTLEQLPFAATGDPVIASKTQLAAIDSATGRVEFYTRQANQLKRRGSVACDSIASFKGCRIVRGEKPGSLGIEVSSAPNTLVLTVSLSNDGVFEFRPTGTRRLTVSDCPIQYGIVPSFVGTDLVYTAKSHPGLDRLYVPSMNLVVGLLEGNDCMLVGAWPSGQQLARFETKSQGGQRTLDSFSLDTAGKSFYLSCVEGANLWHAEPLKAAYVEKDTPIDWKRPFEAKWIGRFFLPVEEIDYPFYFRYERMKMWGRCIRGWFYYPVRFDGEKTILHFEKHFPPQGEMLIYFLEEQPGKPKTGPAGSPLGIMTSALGRDEAEKLLDLAGVEERLLLKHGNAVCAMTNTSQKYLDEGQQVEQRVLIQGYCDDVSDFIGMIRQRITEYGALATEMGEFLDAQAKANPKLADAVAGLKDTLQEMEETRKNGMPAATLQEVRQWTDQMKRYAGEVQLGNNKKFEKLAAQCRSVAGSQDDLARDLSVLAIRLTEEAARMGVQSPEHVQLAEAVIAKTKQVLRKPTWWEPRRQYWPKSDPGRP